MESPVEKEKEIGVLMLGLDQAGKTSLLYKLKLSDENKLPIVPTIGYNVETIEYEGKKYTIWDVGGRPDVRVLWKYYTENKSAVIFVIDAANCDRLVEAKKFLFDILSHEELCNAALLVIANKQDKTNCMSIEDLGKHLDLESIQQTKRIIETSIFDRNTLNEILKHLNDMKLC
ncbi:uncharacterized protein ACRADG_006479 [Cochliomyia hominivorax]